VITRRLIIAVLLIAAIFPKQALAESTVSFKSDSVIGIKPIHQPRLHAKVLAWDNDNLAVTSQNWLSADPSDVARRSEIGVFVESNRIADYLIRRFDHARS
jgi:hypothetical protein